MSFILRRLSQRGGSPPNDKTIRTIPAGRPTCAMLPVHLTISSSVISPISNVSLAFFQHVSRIFLENDQSFRSLKSDLRQNFRRAVREAGTECEGEWLYSILFETDGEGMERKRISESNWEECRGWLLDQARANNGTKIEVGVNGSVVGEKGAIREDKVKREVEYRGKENVPPR